MSRYVIENSDYTVNYGKYSDLVHSKHIKDYGEKSALSIRESMKNAYADLLKQYHDPKKNNNSLFIGKIQSGKTSNLEMITALALDNDYNMIIIYGGYDTKLLDQTKKRFTKTFEAEEWDSGNPKILCTDNKKEIEDVDNSLIEDIFDEDRPIITISMKSSYNINKVNAMLKRIESSNIKALIIDDEGDQASLNIEKDKENEKSATYAAIVNMKNTLGNPLYISVTATPQANIFLDSISELRPDSIHLAFPGDSYCGGNVFHLEDNNIVQIIKNDVGVIDKNILPPSLKEAISYYIVASVIMNKRGIKKNDMIIHSFWERDDHKSLYTMINTYLDSMSGMFEEEDQKQLLKREINDVYEKYISSEIKEQYPFETLFEDTLFVIKKIRIVLQNSDGDFTQQNLDDKRYKLYIGGNLLQRGLTFDYLTTTYFTRWPNSPKMDTNLQRARWFGYREKYLDLCKVFTLREIANEFTNLADIENDLWIQFVEAENGDINIDDIIIDSTNTSQQPTSKTKVKYIQQKFIDPWRKQKLFLMDRSQIDNNKEIIDSILDKYIFSDVYYGRRKKDAPTGEVAHVSVKDLKKILMDTNGIFQSNSFDTKQILALIENEEFIPLLRIGMNKKETRVRSLQEGTNYIKVLHQGPDSKYNDQVNYEGDHSVLEDRNKVNVQMFEIIPKRDQTTLEEYKQYIFAIYVPGSFHSFYQKG